MDPIQQAVNILWNSVYNGLLAGVFIAVIVLFGLLLVWAYKEGYLEF